MDIYDKQALLKDLVKHPGANIFVEVAMDIVKKTKEKQLSLDPYKEQSEIMRCKQLVFLIEEEIPKILEGILNYDSSAIDKMVAPKRRWYFWKVFGK